MTTWGDGDQKEKEVIAYPRRRIISLKLNRKNKRDSVWCQFVDNGPYHPKSLIGIFRDKPPDEYGVSVLEWPIE